MSSTKKTIRVVFLGAPGSGKGTQALMLAKARNVAHISTGEIMRQATASGSDLGKKVKGYLDSGALVPDEVVIEIIRERLLQPDVHNGFLLDGFPRTVEQARQLTAVLEKLGMPLTHVLDISVPQEVLMQRIRSRAQQGSGRSDDNDEVMARRLKIYWEQTAPVGAYYRDLGLISQLNGLGTVEEVHQRVVSALG